MDEGTKQILEIVHDIQERMATKGQLESVRQDLQAQINVNTKTLESHTKAIEANTKAIEKLQVDVRDLGKHTREDVDSVISRVAVLEKRVDAIA